MDLGDLAQQLRFLALLPLARTVFGIPSAMYALRNARMRAHGVPDSASDLLRRIVLSFSLCCVGILALQLVRDDVPLMLLVVLPLFAFGFALSVMLGILAPRPTFRGKRFWRVIVLPTYAALSPVSEPVLKEFGFLLVGVGAAV